MGAPRTCVSPMANRIEKNTICSTLFVAIASKKLVGTTSRTWSPKLFGAASFGPACAASAASSAAVSCGLTPGFTRFTAASPTTSATVVTISK